MEAFYEGVRARAAVKKPSPAAISSPASAPSSGTPARNPSGQWLYVEAGAAHRVSEAFASLLWSGHACESDLSAMFSLIEAARRMREHGAPLKIVAFDSDAPPDVRDAEMGQRLAAARQHDPRALFVVVTGDVHASREPDAAFVPMAVSFAGLTEPHHIVSLALKHSGGRAWVCTDRCGPHDAAGTPDPGPPRIELFERTTRGFDGVFHVGTISASAPAVAAVAP